MFTVFFVPKRHALVLLSKTAQREAKIRGRMKFPEMKKSAKYLSSYPDFQKIKYINVRTAVSVIADIS